MTSIVSLVDGRKLLVMESRNWITSCLKDDGHAKVTFYYGSGSGPAKFASVFAPHVISVEDE